MARKFKLVGAETYNFQHMTPDTATKGTIVTVEDDGKAEHLSSQTYIDSRGEKVPYFEEVDGDDAEGEGEGESAKPAPAVKTAARRAR